VTDAYPTWFTDEFYAAYGGDALRDPFDPEQTEQRIITPGLDLLIYRAEDMSPSAAGSRSYCGRAGCFWSGHYRRSRA
jgi:hypothetical protein